LRCLRFGAVEMTEMEKLIELARDPRIPLEDVAAIGTVRAAGERVSSGGPHQPP